MGGLTRFTMPEPEPPDFGRLPPGTRAEFEVRLERLPVGRIRTGIGADAVVANEGRAVRQFADRHRLDHDQRRPLETWHYRATRDRLRLTRPDLEEARLPGVVRFRRRPPTLMSRLRFVLAVLGSFAPSLAVTRIRRWLVAGRAMTLRRQHRRPPARSPR